MNRFLLDKIDPSNKVAVLDDPEQLHHLRDVLRLKPGELVGVFDRQGNEGVAQVVLVGTKKAELEIKQSKAAGSFDLQLTVACAIPKKAKIDEIIDKLTQLGVDFIVPLESARVIVRMDKHKKLHRFQRWEKIVLSALKQSQSNRFTTVKPVMGFEALLAASGNFDLKLIPTLEGPRKTLRDIFNHSSRRFKRIIVLIGPEGDFSPQEVALAKAAGFLPVTLGQQVLRVDTAAIGVASFIKFNAQR